MNEFSNRIDLQREVIKIVNSAKFEYEITGLSKNAIERWLMDNRLDTESDLTKLLFIISSKLFFLANKSQEQITSGYKKMSSEVSNLVENLRDEILEQ
ncbi:hypothetical protein PI23P_10015 [Polaribacter irgensii 23-P]|uniref:Uncharacterized protein n=1 Tax=Polaribacter irgensii 23-P TaxID=313594 RepID=A4C0L2_9FLAO|nr:hypothetical protein [Polaribacter irgensii]EAR12955.1 hypothetical protein PI23P_10015 [Polaribacter irgensii 23-P]